MKPLSVLLLTATAGIAVSAKPHHNHMRHHQGAEKRAPNQVMDIINVPGPTVIVYEFKGQQISAADVEEGLRNGSLVLASGGTALPTFVAPSTAFSHFLSTISESTVAPSSTETSTSTSSTLVETIDIASAPQSTSTSTTVAPLPTTTSSSLVVETTPAPIPTTSSTSSTPPVPSPTSTTAQAAPPPPPPPAAKAPVQTQAAGVNNPVTSFSSSASSSSGGGVYAQFPNGQIDCSDFPSAYGAVPLSYLGLGGWAGIQSPGNAQGGFSDIMTMVPSLCSDGDCCTEGSFCSYACPDGFQKSQWPNTQGSTGQSIGGIQCKNGKLHLTNPSMSTSLCVPGTQEVNVMVQNTLNQNVAVCRTDYPGTESETIPTNALPGQTTNLTCPDATNYYSWKGMSTSAQYYVNPAGVSPADGCTWGSPNQPWGNYAPLNLGVGYSNGMAWLSIFQNSPTTNAKLAFTVELIGDDMNGRCKYENGQYCSGDNYQNCSPTTGCTVAVRSGTATYVFS